MGAFLAQAKGFAMVRSSFSGSSGEVSEALLHLKVSLYRFPLAWAGMLKAFPRKLYK